MRLTDCRGNEYGADDMILYHYEYFVKGSERTHE